MAENDIKTLKVPDDSAKEEKSFVEKVVAGAEKIISPTKNMTAEEIVAGKKPVSVFKKLPDTNRGGLFPDRSVPFTETEKAFITEMKAKDPEWEFIPRLFDKQVSAWRAQLFED